LSSRRGPGGGLTAEAFACLLARLAPDAERAGAAYEELRRALVHFFTWRGTEAPDECADDALDRLAARLHEGVAVDDVPRYTHGIARLVLLEYWRRPESKRAAAEDLDGRRAAVEPPHDDALHDCLGRCLDELPSDGRGLILSYYVSEGRTRIEGRRRLARELGLTESALRNRAQRLRDRLEACIGSCLGARTAPLSAGKR
jgi:DNA-directed RNA polymerase specialized sigma24 family protein